MMKPEKFPKLNYTAVLSGVLGPLTIAVGMLVSGLTYVGVEGQAYNPLNHFVSELGEVGVSDWAIAFNLGLVIGGIFNTIFMVYLASQIRHWVRYPLGMVGVVATVCGGLVGIFPMNNLGPHILVALTFFDLGMVMAFLYSVVFLFKNIHPFPRWMAVPGFINALSFALFNNFPPAFEAELDFQDGMAGMLQNRPDLIPLALLEWVVVLGILIWVLILGIYLVRSRLATGFSGAENREKK